MTILRLRAEVADERGRLGRLATAIAACRGDILGLDIHFVDGARVADEFVVRFGDGGSAEALTTALRRAGGMSVDAEHLDQHDLVDPVARAIDIGVELVADGTLDRGLERAVAALVRADRVEIVDRSRVEASPALRSLCLGDLPTVHHVDALGPPTNGLETPWTLVLAGARERWVVAQRARPPFSASEIARVAALIRLSWAVAGEARSLEAAAAARVGPPRPLVRSPGSFRRAARAKQLQPACR